MLKSFHYDPAIIFSMKKPEISAVIPAYNEEILLPKCLDSVFNQSLPREFYEVIVVDNASTDKTAVIAREKGARVLWEGKRAMFGH